MNFPSLFFPLATLMKRLLLHFYWTHTHTFSNWDRKFAHNFPVINQDLGSFCYRKLIILQLLLPDTVLDVECWLGKSGEIPWRSYTFCLIWSRNSKSSKTLTKAYFLAIHNKTYKFSFIFIGSSIFFPGIWNFFSFFSYFLLHDAFHNRIHTSLNYHRKIERRNCMEFQT